MKVLLAGLLAMNSPVVMSASHKISCKVFHNLQEVSTTQLVLNEGEKNLSVARFELFEMFLSSLGGERFELQMLNNQEPSRAYATGSFSPTLELSLWTREFLLETKCQRISE